MPYHRTVKFHAFITTSIFAVLFATAFTCYAQKPNAPLDVLLKQADSLFNKNPEEGIKQALLVYRLSLQQKNAVIELKSLNYLAGYYLQANDYHNAGIFATKSAGAAKQHGIDSLKSDALVLLGMTKYGVADYQQAINTYQEAIAGYNKTKPSERLAITYLNIGWAQRKMGRFELANSNYFKAADIFQSLHSSENVAATYNAIGSCYSLLKNCGKAIEYYHKSLSMRTSTLNVAESYNNIGNVFTNCGSPDSAIYYLTKALKIRGAETDSADTVLPLQNLGFSWKLKGDLKKAGHYIKRSLIIAAKYNMQEEAARGNLDMAEIHLANKNYTASLTAADLSQKTAMQIKLPELLISIYELKARLFEQTNLYKQALLYTQKRDVIKDSIFTTTKNLDIARLETQFQTKQREGQIRALSLQSKLQKQVVSQQSLSITILILAAVALLILFIIAYHNFLLKNKANQKIQMLMREIHHRVSNNLMIVSSLFTMQIEMSDDTTKNALRENESRILAMNLIHNKLYLNHDTTQIAMEEYLTKLLYHIKSAFGCDEINLCLEIDNITIEADKAVSIGLLITELATNSCKYAFTDMKNKPCEIFLSLKSDAKKILLDFGDNGKGIQNNNTQKPQFGLKLVSMLSQQLGAKLEMDNDGKAYYRMQINT